MSNSNERNGSADSNPTPAETPASAGSGMITVWDALSWVAFREFRRQPDLSDLMETVDRRTDDHLAAILAALEARASPEPFCVVEPVIDNELYPNEALYAHRAWSPKGPVILRRIRAKARAREG